MTVTVLAHGCWDGLHVGHVRHLKAARALGDRLVVGVTADEFVAKGPNRPHFNLADRLEAIRGLGVVDEAIPVHAMDPCGLIRDARPGVYVKGREYEGRHIPELDAVASYGGRVEYVGETLGSSSTALNAEIAHHPFIRSCREKYSALDVTAALAKIATLDVAVVGDAIIDEYVPAELQGLTSKGGAASIRIVGPVRDFDGGAWALENHVRSMGVKTGTARRTTTPTIKRRYYTMAGNQMRTLAAVEEIGTPAPVITMRNVPSLFIVGDYGHGGVPDSLLEVLNRCDRTAVTCQTNSANYGLHVLTDRYRKVGLFVADDRELKLTVRKADPNAADLSELGRRLDAERCYWTRGEHSTFAAGATGIHECPALESRPVDPLGAGDAFLVMAALCWAANVPEDLSLLLAQIAGAQLTRVLGNEKPLDQDALYRTAAAILA